jgi:hypothetical protein
MRAAMAGVFLAAGLVQAQTATRPQPGAPAQATPPTGLIAGQIVDAATSQPVGDGVVSLTQNVSGPVTPSAREAGRRKVLTDGSGRFAFSGLARGSYSLTVDKPGYVAGVFGRITPRGRGTSIDLADGERRLDARVLIWKHAVIAGRVLDEAGEPVIGVEVRALRHSAIGGRPGFSDAVTATTDDRGMYRVAGLSPGDTFIVAVPSVSTTLPASMLGEFFEGDPSKRQELQSVLYGATNTLSRSGPQNQQVGDYIVQIGIRSAVPPAAGENSALGIYPTTFYGQVTDQGDASLLTLRAGEIRTGVDVRLRPVPSVRVSGTIVATDGPAGPIAVRLVRPSTAALVNPAFAIATGVTDRNGDFTLLGVPPGEYVLQGTRVAPAGQTLAVRMPLIVPSRDLAGVRATVTRGFRISGRIVTDDSSQALPPQRLGLNIDSRDWPISDYSETMTAADGTFSSWEIPPGLFQLSVPVPSGWFVKSVTAQGRDVADLPFEVKEAIPGITITLSRRGASVSGAVRTASGAPDSAAAVLVFSTDPRQWVDYSPYSRRLKDARTTRAGTFEIRDLPAGDYFIVAVPPAAMTWKPGFLEAMSRIATRVTLGEAEQRSIDLRVSEAR